jgi:FtsZ-binding cell division protein ZapB
MMTHKSYCKTTTKLESATLPYLQTPKLLNSTGNLERNKLNEEEEFNLGREIAAVQANIESIEVVLANFDEDEWKEKLVEIKHMTSEQKRTVPWVEWRNYNIDELKNEKKELKNEKKELEQRRENLRKEKKDIMDQKVQLSGVKLRMSGVRVFDFCL